MEIRDESSDSAGHAGLIAVEGRNCQTRARASRVAFLIDAASYFAAFKSAVARAQRSIFIVGWDLDSRARLTLNGKPPLRERLRRETLPDELGALLRTVVSRRRGLHAYILKWDAPMVYALEREWIQQVEFRWRSPRRLHFRFDSETPIGASQHQKIVVIDDAIAFLGGIDLTTRRWDTPEHILDDPRRVDPLGVPYEPFHDVQVAVDGEVAAALGRLVRERWRRAGGCEPRSFEPSGDPWPQTLVPDFSDVEVAIALTYPAFRGRREVREVEALFIDAIRAARRRIYIENQYFSSATVARALAQRLRENYPPELLIVLPRHSPGWLEQETMDVVRARTLRELRKADHKKRLRVCYPVVRGAREVPVMVHSKVMAVDERIIIAGSANLSNRSMGFDSECDVALESAGDPAVEVRIAAVRDRLLGEHLGSRPEQVARLFAEGASLAQIVDRLGRLERSLEPLLQDDFYLLSLLPETDILDPARPVEIELVAQQVVETGRRSRLAETFVPGAVMLLAAIAIVALVVFGGLDPASEPRLREVMTTLCHGATGIAILAALYVAASLILFPILALIVVTIWVFGPVTGALYALLGSSVSAAVGFAIGRALGLRGLARILGARLVRLSRLIALRGVAAVTVIRLLPIAPFTLVNLAAGAGHVTYRDFMVGTVLGMIPGIGAFAILLFELRLAIQGSELAYTLAFIVSLAAVGSALLWARRRFHF